MNEIEKLQPTCIWRNFYALTQIPRPSGHVEKIQQFLLDFAKKVGVEAFQDPAGNIVMRKPATPGMENRKCITMQAHMDMVPQKTPESKHDFEKDPIEPYIDGEWIKARGTTLGADDGLGVAAIMAVMEDNTLKHGPIEGLITKDEETGMYGANDLPKGQMKGDILFNLDSETWGKFVIGSAGGIDVTCTRKYNEVKTASGDTAVRITLKGLKGGHSGLEIHEGRANANKLMARLLQLAIVDHKARLVSWHGGNMRNAIPFKAETVLVVPEDNLKGLKKLVKTMKAQFESEFKFIEDTVDLTIKAIDRPKMKMALDDQTTILRALYACHDGVVRYIPAYPNVVETSSNLAIIDIEDGKASVKILARSAREDMKEYIVKMLMTCFHLADFKVETGGDYIGWDPNPDSEALHMLLDLYKQLFNEDGIIQVDHAGLECSIILGKYPHMDVVSFGPTLRSPHTTIERAYIPAAEPFWRLLVKALEEAPVKK